MYKTHFLSGDPSKVSEFKKYSNRLNYLKNISKKAYFGKHFDLYEGNLKATWELNWYIDQKEDQGPDCISKNSKE